MKKLIIVAFVLFGAASISKAENFRGGITFEYFYSTLSPYGEWIQIDAGLYGWHPYSIRANWRPYMIGRWYWTTNGWYWDSFEPFGWAVYHYGRWYYDDFYGWIWIPDYEWAPAWVEWRYNDDYIGWAPLPPYARFSINFGIHFSISWHSRPIYWNFVPYRHFCHVNVYNYILDDRNVDRIFSRTRYRTNYYSNRGRIVNGGIDKDFVERKGGYRITERSIERTDNYDAYKKYRNGKSDRLIDFVPSEREISKYRDSRKVEAKRYSGRNNLQLDKIIIEKNNIERRNFGDRSNKGGNDIRSRGLEENRSSGQRSGGRELKKYEEKRVPIFRSSERKFERPREIQPERRNSAQKTKRISAPERKVERRR